MAHIHSFNPELDRATIRRLVLSVCITLAFVAFEGAAGIYANSLALLTDAAHNLTDVLALALTAWAVWITTKPARSHNTFGYHRAGILVALVNSTTLVLIALGIFYHVSGGMQGMWSSTGTALVAANAATGAQGNTGSSPATTSLPTGQ